MMQLRLRKFAQNSRAGVTPLFTKRNCSPCAQERPAVGRGRRQWKVAASSVTLTWLEGMLVQLIS